VNISDRSRESLLDYIDTSTMFILPNTAGLLHRRRRGAHGHARTRGGLSNWVKLEVIGDERTLFPDNEALVNATRILVREGFVVLPYHERRPDRLPQARGCGRRGGDAARRTDRLGPRHPERQQIRIIREFSRVPVIVDAGVGTASDATVAMELGVDGVLMNTAIAGAQQPIAMAEAMKHAVIAGRLAHISGRIPKKMYATASSPVEGLVGR
jgi:thiazole synthase